MCDAGVHDRLVAEEAGRLACRGASCSALGVWCRLSKRPGAAGRRPCSTAHHLRDSQWLSVEYTLIELYKCIGLKAKQVRSAASYTTAMSRTVRRRDIAVVSTDTLYSKHASDGSCTPELMHWTTCLQQILSIPANSYAIDCA